MRRNLIAVLILGALLAGARPACAGVYTLSDEPKIWPLWPLPVSYPHVKLFLANLRLCDDRAQQPGRPPEKERRIVLDQVSLLQLKERANALGTLDRIDLGSYLMRLGRDKDAIPVLETGLNVMAPGDPARFLLLTNLATAYHNLGVIDRAIGYQEQALAAWPDNWPGWGNSRTLFYRRTERYYLDLLRLRSKETGRWTSVDDLFPGVKFDDPRERYEAGSIPARMLDRLPVEAAPIVLQMLISQPSDDRLLWLFGEILNSQKEIGPAADIFKELVSNRGLTNVPALTRHRQVLVRAAESLHLLLNEVQDKPFFNSQLLWAFQPRGGLFAPMIGIAATEGSSLLVPVILQKAAMDQEVKVLMGQQPQPRLPREPDDGGVAANAASLPFALDWRQIIVSFIAGILTAVLVRLQIIEWRRRSVPAAPAPRPTSARDREAASVQSGQTNITT